MSIAITPSPSSAAPELLAPAGDFDAACAALHYGADAVYTGLPRFSARADATNLTPEELRNLVAYAHALPRPRRVYVTLNTLTQDRDLAGVIEILEELDDIGVDALIVQDLGLARIASRCFPRLRLHASTQLAVHNLAGARALAGLGFRRVVLARELTLPEIARIAREAKIEVEIFVHGALCYSYSGLCLFSSHQAGRSGNRGRCAYCCREPLTLATPDDKRTEAPANYPFSMRDLALAPLLPELTATGVTSLKIEGRMKSACYVACVTDYYRRKLDQALQPETEAALVQDLQTIFSRPWTQLYTADRETPATAVIDAFAVGHRGAAIGEVLAVTRDSRRGKWLKFQTRRALEKHDGLQLDPPRGGRPFGFAVDEFRRVGSSHLEVSLPAGTSVEVRLPEEELPEITTGATVYCSASQAVRRRYQVQRPRPSDCRLTQPVHVQATLRPEGLSLTATVTANASPDAKPPLPGTTAREDARPPVPADYPEKGGRASSRAANIETSRVSLSASISIPLTLTPARQAGQTAIAIQRALERSGETPWQMVTFDLDDPQKLFVPASILNEARRQLFDALTIKHETARQTRRAEACALFAVENTPASSKPSQRKRPSGVEENTGGRRTASDVDTPPLWSVKVDLAGPVNVDLTTADEIILYVGHLSPANARKRLEAWLALVPRAHLRLALPLITRQPEDEVLLATISALLADGWRQWECADLSGWQVLQDATREPLDLTADWSFYALNHVARDLLAELGISRTVASPEDSEINIAALALHEAPVIEVLVWQQTPLFISETAPVVGTGQSAPWTLVNRRGNRLITRRLDNRWVTVAEVPLCLTEHLPALQRHGVRRFRADFLWSPPDASHIAACWRAVQSGQVPDASHKGNFLRGLS